MAQEFCTPADLRRFGFRAEALAAVQVLDGQQPPIQSASARVSGYLRQAGYNLPLVSWGDDLKECTAVLAAWTIYGTTRARVGDNPEENTIYLRFKDWINWLKDVAAKRTMPSDIVDSPAPTGPPLAGTPRVRSNVSRLAGSSFAGERRRGRSG